MFIIRLIDKDVKYTHIHIHVCVYTHNGTLLSHEKNEILPFMTTWIDLECILLSKMIRESQILYITNTIYHIGRIKNKIAKPETDS